MAESIFHMLAAYEITGQKYYLDRADYFAQQAVKIFIDDRLCLRPAPPTTITRPSPAATTSWPLC
jgi:uncharacterized protein YyaL (SSP411 family)